MLRVKPQSDQLKRVVEIQGDKKCGGKMKRRSAVHVRQTPGSTGVLLILELMGVGSVV